jgi:hypothetical protein
MNADKVIDVMNPEKDCAIPRADICLLRELYQINS